MLTSLTSPCPPQSAVNMDDKRLICEADKQQILYDPQQPFYEDILKKDEVWKEIGVALGVATQ